MHGRSVATLAALISLALPAAASAATFTVQNGNDSGAGSLRAAIAAANADVNRDTIVFDAGVTTAAVATPLTISAPVLLDGGDGVPVLQGSGTAGIVVEAAAGAATQLTSTRIEQLVLDGFPGGVVVHADFAQLADLEVRDGSGDAVAIAADASDVFLVRGFIADNGGDGVELAGTGATIGGPSQANTIVRNGGAGVRVLTGASGTVSENLIGITTLVAAGNGTGVALGSDLVQVFDNFVSGNTGDGIAMSACGDVLGNVIGLDDDGITARGNGGNGISVGAASCQVGGSSAGNGNTISANAGEGIGVSANGAIVQGNRIGTDTVGTVLRGNGGHGIEVTGDTPLIGAAAAAAANVIAGNGGNGIRLDGADDATVAGNAIRDNTAHGVGVTGAAGDVATIGTAGAGANQIHDNGADGVAVTGSATARIREDAITGNGGLGIDLSDDGVTANDALDADSGPNGLQNFPALASVRRESGSLRVKGTIDVPASGLVTIDVYESTDCAAGIGEGAQRLGTINLVVAGSGTVSINQALAVDRPAGTDVTATATRGNETSEFSGCATVAEAPATTVSITPATRTALEGGTAAFTVHREGVTTGSADVTWSTHAGTAVSPADYGAAGGTVSFTAGEVDEQISVPIAEDAAVEQDETFTVTLDGVSNATGTEIGGADTGTVTIRSQDEDVFVVTDGGDAPDETIDGVCARAGGGCTLRAAIQEANADVAPDRDSILVADSVPAIALDSALPAIAEPLVFSGEIQAGRVTVDGNDVAGLTVDGAGAAQQTQIFDVDLVDAPLDVEDADVLLQDADVSGASGPGVRFGPGATGAVGGASGHGNRIFGNGAGVLLAGAGDVNLSHNRIGLDGANGGDGVVSDDAGAQIFDNVISGNGGAGLRLLACGDVVTGNRIGTQADGTGAVANGGAGVVVAAAGCRLGGGATPNVVGGNAGHGVLVTGAGAVLQGNQVRGNGGDGVATTGSGTALLTGNAIDANGGLGIDLGDDGVTAQGLPVLAAVSREGGKLRVTGALADGGYVVELFANAACDPSGHGEGATVLGSAPAAVTGGALAVTVPADAPAGTIVSATVTRAGATSEFSACATVKESSGTTPPPGGGAPLPPGAAADPRSAITSPRGRVRARRLKRIKGIAADAARVDVAAIRVRDGKCYALRRNGRFRTRPGRCTPRTFFKATGTTTWSFRLKRRFPRGRFRIYSRATAADGTVEAPPTRVRVRVRR